MSQSLRLFHPRIQGWFADRFGSPTDIQDQAWPVIARGEHALITAPTGSGKTLTAFLWALNQLITGVWPTGGTRVLYVSPLKALNNDIQRNLIDPLAELERIFVGAGEAFPQIRVGSRSGDTPPAERQRMVRHPPEILITTPESLNLLQTSPKARHILAGIETVILDEIHAVAHTKRGTHLITAVDRLLLLNDEFQRIALSATVKPLEVVADFVGGYMLDTHGGEARYTKRPVTVLQSRDPKPYELEVRYPPIRPHSPEDGGRWPALSDALKEIIAKNRSTLVFTNTRRHCERISLHLNKDEEELTAYAHHGSLSREIRAVVEQRLKNGELAAIVATSSLELGIDIGDLDEVALIQTPFSVAATLQRVGRAGHRVGQTSRGVLFPLHGRDVLEAAVMVRAVQERDLEPIHIVSCPLDVLAQIVLSMASVEQWDLDELFAFICASSPYRNLTRAQFDLVINMLAGRYADSRIRALQSLVSLDLIDNTLQAKPAAARIIYSSGGTIPDRGLFNLRLKDSLSKIGELDEEFVWERHLGEVFSLGTQYWKIQQITHNDVFVTPSVDSPNVVPFWKADQFSRGFHFSERTAQFLEEANDRLNTPDFKRELRERHGLADDAAETLIDFLQRQRDITGADLPHRHHILVERCTDHRRDKNHTQYILHTLWGGAVNRPLALAMGQAWEDRFGEPIEVFGDNDAVVLVLPRGDEIADCFELVDIAAIESLLRKRLERTGIFGARFRENAARALLLPRQSFGKRMPLWMTRIRSKQLFDAVLKYDDFPILAETWRTCLQDEFDLDTLRALLREVADGRIRQTEIKTTEASPFAGSVVWGQTNKYMYADDTPERPVTSNLSDDVLKDVVFSDSLRPRIDSGLVKTYEQKLQRVYAGYSPATAQNLLDWLKERVFIPRPEWDELLEAIERDHGANAVEMSEAIAVKISVYPHGYVARETMTRFDVSAFFPTTKPSGDRKLEEAEALTNFVEEWIRFYGPIGLRVIFEKLGIEESSLDRALETLVDARTVIRGYLTKDAEEIEYCDAENYEVLLRISRREAQPQVKALPIDRLPLFLAAHQSMLSQERRDRDVVDVLDGLLGYPYSPEMLEKEFLPARIQSYSPAKLDPAFAEGDLIWVGVERKRVFLSPFSALEMFTYSAGRDAECFNLLPTSLGRFSFSDLLEHTKLSSEDLTQRLWEGVWAGRVTNDAYETLRKGIASRFKASGFTPPARPSRRSGFRRWKATRPLSGHWLAVPEVEAPIDLIDEAELIKDRARVLLERYGILFRQLLHQEMAPFRWGSIFKALRLMELSGEILTGHFFEDVPGLQFMTPGALRLFQGALPEDAVYWINATDPISPCGLELEALKGKFPKRLKTTHLVFHGSKLVLESMKSGKEMRIYVEPEGAALPSYFAVFEHMLTRSSQPMRHIAIHEINGEPATASPYVTAFDETFEVHSDPGCVTLWARR